ncbi:triple QxxK/R motif-containing protein-like [Physella acuta]|uniref:triple QxxK/R motif-containing protein-like n=1 Tax=Physella acuta TaxID=109671 RepID=UPI0027DC8F1C|nr:triple QxxK/R motif-containing protein-like [Physella acuta]
MGKKDASANRSQPLEQYRKQIGKQDWKKSKKEIRSMKSRSEYSNEYTPQVIVLWIGAIILVCSSGYMLLFWYLGAASLENLSDPPPV